MKNIKATVNSLLAALGILTDEEMLALTNAPGKVKDFLATLVQEEIANTFVVPLSDTEMLDQFPQFADRLPPWRKLAASMGYTGPVVWHVKQGFTLKKHAPLVGPCYKNLQHLQNWNFNDDHPTDNCLVFWVPRLAENSTGQTIRQMREHLVLLKVLYKLPGDHATTFGSIQLQFALILAHFKRTGERVPLSRCYMASDTLFSGGIHRFRFIAGCFGDDGLNCNYWDDLISFDYVGFVLLGVEKLEQ